MSEQQADTPREAAMTLDAAIAKAMIRLEGEAIDSRCNMVKEDAEVILRELVIAASKLPPEDEHTVLATPIPSNSFAQEEPQPSCEGGVTARWCSRCGTCTCQIDQGGVEWVESADCPIHGPRSTHAEDEEPQGGGCATSKEAEFDMDAPLNVADALDRVRSLILSEAGRIAYFDDELNYLVSAVRKEAEQRLATRNNVLAACDLQQASDTKLIRTMEARLQQLEAESDDDQQRIIAFVRENAALRERERTALIMGLEAEQTATGYGFPDRDDPALKSDYHAALWAAYQRQQQKDGQ